MLIKYYKNPLLAYSNRQRYKTFPISLDTPYKEEQKAVKLNDGAETFVTTKVENLCDYVIIGDTRWYVVAYTYENGGQITMRLRRDVVGEFGITNIFGKIDRGYTDTFLRNRKELSLNQRLIDRIPIIPNTDTYGNFTVSTHDFEKWGVIYIAKPTDGTPFKNINIPEFNPSNYNSGLQYIANETQKVVSSSSNPYVTFILGDDVNAQMFMCSINFSYNQTTKTYSYNVGATNIGTYSSSNATHKRMVASIHFSSANLSSVDMIREVKAYLEVFADKIILNYTNNTPANSYSLPTSTTIEMDKTVAESYPNYVVENPDNNKMYSYTLTDTSYYKYGNNNENIGDYFYNDIIYPTNGTVKQVELSGGTVISLTITVGSSSETNRQIEGLSWMNVGRYKFNATELSGSQQGNIHVSFTTDFVDEPYVIYIIPLYDVEITTSLPGYPTMNIDKQNAFRVFNTIIESFSGENGYLVDAQIYPYCPDLIKVGDDGNSGLNIIQDIPIFEILTTSYSRDVSVSLKAIPDVKKDYIKRQYSIMAPDQSEKFIFNFYDYTNRINEQNGVNIEKMNFTIKTALKPFKIISSLVIIPDEDSLIGKTYNSDLRGCRPTGNGFECSLSTDQYQQYLRNNSNYSEFFRLEREELQENHRVERNNEKASIIANTASATFMGAVGGGSVGSAIPGAGAGIGAAIGGLVSGIAVGSSMAYQYNQNEGLRNYEERLLKERQTLTIGTIKNLPNQVSRISSFNEIIMKDFYFVVEIYECSEEESEIVDIFVDSYSYEIGVYGLYENFINSGWYIRGSVLKSNLIPILHNLLDRELQGGIYYND